MYYKCSIDTCIMSAGQRCRTFVPCLRAKDAHVSNSAHASISQHSAAGVLVQCP